MTQQNYSQSTLSDVPQIVYTILALRDMDKYRVITTKSQADILRQLPSDVLVAVAVELKKAEAVR
jgi:hypothetical protein